MLRSVLFIGLLLVLLPNTGRSATLPMKTGLAGGTIAGPPGALVGVAIGLGILAIGWILLNQKADDEPKTTVEETEKCPNAPTTPQTAQDEINSLGELEGKTEAEIEAKLKEKGYTSVTGNNGGKIWTKPTADGNTSVVRIDPAKIRNPPKGFADETPHIHKEIVPTNKVTNGNYKPSDAIKLNDKGQPSSEPAEVHIPLGK